MGMGVFDQLYTAANENVADISAILRDFNKTDYDTDLAEMKKVINNIRKFKRIYEVKRKL